MATLLTVEALLDIISSCTHSIDLGRDPPGMSEWQRRGESVEVIDAHAFEGALRAILDAQPPVVFANLIGMTLAEAMISLATRAPYQIQNHPVTDLIATVENGVAVSRGLEPRSGALTVGLTDNVISEIFGLIP